MKKRTIIITIAILLAIAIAVGIAVALSSDGNIENEKELILPEAKNDKIETKLPDDAEKNSTPSDAKEKVNASYDDFMEIYEQYKNETDETKKREQLDKIQAILDSASK